MHNKTSEDELDNIGRDAKVMETISRSKMKGLIAEEVDRIDAECSPADVQTQIEKTLVEMIHLSTSAV